MIHLPAEILLLTFRYLEKLELKKVRLVNPDWCDIATELLFDRIFISGREKDVTVFREWTANKRCSAAVRELIFDMSMMDPSLSQLQYMESLWYYIHDHLVDPLPGRRMDFQGSDRAVQEIFHHVKTGRLLRPEESVSRGLEDFFFRYDDHYQPIDLIAEFETTSASAFCQNAVVVAGYERYLYEAVFEQDMRTSGELLLHLVRGLKTLPYVRCIRIEEEDPKVIDWYDFNFDPLSLAPLYTWSSPFRRSWHPLYLLPFDRHGTDRNPQFSPPPELPVTYVAHFQTLIRAISLSDKNISKLHLGSIDAHTAFPTAHLGLLFGCGGNMRAHSTFVMDNLRSLTLYFTPPMLCKKKNDNYYTELQQYLLTLPNLSHLDLERGRSISRYPDFADLFPQGLVLPKLRHLRSVGGRLLSDNLVHFVFSHNLQSIVLEGLYLDDTDPIEGFHVIYQALKQVPKRRIQGLKRELRNEQNDLVSFLKLELTISSNGPAITRSAHIGHYELRETVDIDLSSNIIDPISKQNAFRLDPPFSGPTSLLFR